MKCVVPIQKTRWGNHSRQTRPVGSTGLPRLAGIAAAVLLLAACTGTPKVVELPDPAAVALSERAASIFGALPASVPNMENVASKAKKAEKAKVDLGRMLYYDKRLSKNHDIACNSCHLLDAYGVDNEPTSPGHRGQRGGRNSPSVYNAATHIAQFWDGRAADVEAQAKGPPLNPIEMALPSEAFAEGVLASIPGYVRAFDAAFPEDRKASGAALSYDNMARAIGAFERNLMTPGRFDAFMGGDYDALNATEQRGLTTFLSVGCNSCHTGAAVGGRIYRKLGFVIPFPTEDIGREAITGNAADRHVFKVPSLRNVAKTGPYFHDGSIKTLEAAVKIMSHHQIGVMLEDAQVADIVAFLGSLTGEWNSRTIAQPKLPESGPNTPAPDPS